MHTTTSDDSSSVTRTRTRDDSSDSTRGLRPALTFDVIGEPAPQGSKRHVGNGRMIESSRKVGPWRVMVAWYASDAARECSWIAPDSPLAVEIGFRLHRPRSAPKSRLWPDKKPDLDKLARAVFDGLTESGVIRDDAQIVQLTTSKRYAAAGEPTGATITIRGI